MSPSRHTPLKIAFARPWPTTRRGFKLWLFSVVIGARGLLYVTDPSTSSAAMPLPWGPVTPQVWGWIVVAVCAIAIWSSYCHYGRDRYGYAAMSFLAVSWAYLYGYGYVFRDASDAAAQGLLSFTLITVLMLHCAGDPELPKPAERRGS